MFEKFCYGRKQNLYNYLIIFVAFLVTIVSYQLFYSIKDYNISSASQIFKNTINGIVELKSFSEEVGESYGTAIFIRKDGTLITNAHVVLYSKLNQNYLFDHYYIRFASDENYIEVSLNQYDESIDVAVLQMDPSLHHFKPLITSDSSKILNGNKVYAIGNSANYGLSMSEGIIAAPLINIIYKEITRKVIQASVNITEGNSGGALLNNKGELIGITTFRTKDNSGDVIFGIAYCVPINTVLEYIY